jgi:hypothetical protein
MVYGVLGQHSPLRVAVALIAQLSRAMSRAAGATG